MQRKALTHERVFRDEAFATEYARKHQKMGEKVGRWAAKGLSERGFEQGRIIDVGCGSGATAVYLARACPGCEIVGVDLSQPLLQVADASAQASGVSDRVRFEVGDAERLRFDGDSFDVALNLNMAHIVRHPVQMLDEIERMVRADGSLFIADLKRSWLSLFEREMASSLTLAEARHIFAQSKIREGRFSSDLIWWRFEA